MRFSAFALALPALTLAVPLSAAGSDTSTPPNPSTDTKKCSSKRVFDKELGKCVKPEKSSMTGDQLLQTARELAYLDRFDDAQAVLAAHPDQTNDHVLTYWGFTNRKLGRAELANQFYAQAISQNPNNLLARSYRAQGFVSEGKYVEALQEWKEIRARGGAGTWAEVSLRQAIETGQTINY